MAGLGAFIQGAFQGYSFGENVKDKKTQRERDKENDEWRRTQRGWELEDRDYSLERREVDDAWTDESRDYTRGQRSREASAASRAQADRANERSIFESTFTDAQSTYSPGAAAPQVAGSGTPPPAPQGTPETSDRGVIFADVGADTLGGGDGADVIARQPGSDSTGRRPSNVAPVQPMQAPGPMQMPQGPDTFTPPPPRAEIEAQQYAQPPAPVNAIGRDQRTPQMPGPDPIGAQRYAPPMASPNMISDEKAAADMRSPEPGKGVADVAASLRMSQAAQYDPGATMRGKQTFENTDAWDAPQPEVWTGDKTQPQQAMPAAAAGRRPGAEQPVNAPRQAPQQNTLLSAPQNMPKVGQPAPRLEGIPEEARTQGPDQGGAPSIDVAERTAPSPRDMGVMGATDDKKPTEPQRERAAQTFLQHYAETAAPKIVEYYLKTGDVEKATAFDQWAKDQGTQATMAAWAKATHAAAIGDDDGVIDNLVDVYASVDDGYEVVREQSGFKKDKDGKITGAEVAFMNTQTGQVTTRQFDGMEDLIQTSIYALSPEKIFEHMWGQMEAAAEVDAENRKFQQQVTLERIKQGTASQGDLEDIVSRAKRDLARNDYEWSSRTPEEQNRLALELIRSTQAAAAELNKGPMPGDWERPGN